MAGPIQQIPQGLLGLLQLKELGRNPAQLLETVQPTYDLFSQYVERSSQAAIGLFGGNPQTGNIASASIGPHAFLLAGVLAQVPQGETWYVTQIGLTIVGGAISAADTFRGSIGYVTSTQGTLAGVGSDVYSMAPAYQDAITARARFVMVDPMPRPMFVPPGAGFFFFALDLLTATNLNFQLGMRAARIPI